jgi:hypothetical protein
MPFEWWFYENFPGKKIFLLLPAATPYVQRKTLPEANLK